MITMKKTFILSGIIACCILAQACYEDKGNYDYHLANAVTITMPEQVTAYLGETLELTPTVTFANAADATDFEYWWEDVGLDYRDVLHEGLVLAYEPREIGFQDIQLCVKETATNVVTVASLRVNVLSRYTKGWLILREESGETKLSYIRPSYDEDGNRVYTDFTDLYGTLYPDDRLGSGPRALRQVLNGEGGVLVLQDDGSVQLNNVAYHREILLANMFVGDAPAGLDPVDFRQHNNYCGFLLDASGNVYYRGGLQFANIPTQVDGEPLEVKTIFPPASSATFFAVYEEAKNCFTWVYTPNAVAFAVIPAIMPSDAAVSLNFNNLGSAEVLYSSFFKDSYYEANNITIYTNAGSTYVQTCRAEPSYYDIGISNLRHEAFPGAANLTPDSKFYQLVTRDYLFFSSGNVLYYYSHGATTVRTFYTFDPGDEVLDIASNPQESELGVLLRSGKFVTLDILNEHLLQGTLLHEIDLPGTPVDLEYKFTSYTDFQRRTVEENWD
jgi:hypothetical protein